MDLREHRTVKGCRVWNLGPHVSYCETHRILFLDAAALDAAMYDDVPDYRRDAYPERLRRMGLQGAAAVMDVYPEWVVESVAYLNVREGVKLDE